MGGRVEAFRVKGMACAKIQGQEGAQCERSHRRTHMVGGGKLTDEARRNQQPF